MRGRVLDWLFPTEKPSVTPLLREPGIGPETVQPATGVVGTPTSGPVTSTKTGVIVY